MQVYNRSIVLLVIITLMTILPSCMKEDEDSVVLPSPVSTAPSTIPDDVIPAEIRQQFMEHTPIYEGNTPPIISGCYVSSPMKLNYTSDSLPIGFIVADMFYQYGPQKNGLITQYKEKQLNTVRTSSDMKVVGKDSTFSAYYIADGWHDYDHDDYNESYSKFSVVVSGTMSPQGIRNFHYAFITLDKIDPLDTMAAINTFRVYIDADSLAENYPIWKSPMRNLQ